MRCPRLSKSAGTSNCVAMTRNDIEPGMTGPASAGRLHALLERNRLPISLATGAWFWAGCAVYAGFLELPDVAPWVEDAFFWSSAGANAVWWGLVQPHLARHRSRLEDRR